jgi:hypothetical protein
MMPTLEEERSLGLVGPAPGEREILPETRAIKLAWVDHGNYRRLMKLTDEQKATVKKTLKKAHEEWKQNTRLQNNKIRRNIDRLEGISAPKDFPWPDSSNLNIPYTEIQILVATDIVSSTTIEADPMFFAKEMIPSREGHPEEHVDPKIEHWLNWVFKQQLNLEEETRMSIYLAFRDPLSISVLDWVEDTPKEYRIQIFETIEEFERQFPDAEAAGVPQNTYDSWVGQIGVSHEPLALEVEERVVRYRGPKMRTVELKDFIRVPVSCPNLNYTLFHGDQFRERKGYFKAKSKIEWFYKDETKEMLESAPKNKAIDDISQQLDTIEGISSDRLTSDEYDCMRGNLRFDLNDDGEEELYHVVYNPETNNLLRMEKYPYWHNRSNYTIWRIRRKPNRLLGRCFMDMLYDINEEINTQHNQRIDSRTITTVPSFKINANETDLLGLLDKKGYGFYPGCRFVLSNLNNMQQLETKVDFQGTLQEEQNLMQIGEMLTGTGAGGARANPQKDPRASGKKVQQLIGQSNQRIDGYIRELKGSFRETAEQVLELYYQFSPDSVIAFSSYDDSTSSWIRNEIKRVSLRNRNMTIELARTTVLDNPDTVLQRALTDYQIWSKEPLVGMNIQRRWELVRETMFAEKKKNISKLLPPLKQILEEMQDQDKLGQGSPSHQALLEAAHGSQGKRKEPDGKRQGSPDMSPEKLDRSKKGT